MMYSSTDFTSYAPVVWLHVHWLFGGMALFGFLLGLMWFWKYANKKTFLNVFWATVIIGVLGALLTAPYSPKGWAQLFGMHQGSGMKNMMDRMMDFDNKDNE